MRRGRWDTHQAQSFPPKGHLRSLISPSPSLSTCPHWMHGPQPWWCTYSFPGVSSSAQHFNSMRFLHLPPKAPQGTEIALLRRWTGVTDLSRWVFPYTHRKEHWGSERLCRSPCSREKKNLIPYRIYFFQFRIYFCFIDYVKPLTVWILTNCEKFLKS